MKHTFKIKDIIKAIKDTNEGFYGALDAVKGVPDEIRFFSTEEVDKALLKMIERHRANLTCDIFVTDLPEVDWFGGIYKLIKPEFHNLIQVNGLFSDVKVLQLMQIAGLEKIKIEGTV